VWTVAFASTAKSDAEKSQRKNDSIEMGWNSFNLGKQRVLRIWEHIDEVELKGEAQ